MTWRALWLMPLIGLALACSDKERPTREAPRDPPRERRVIEPPAGIVRPLPPHAIRAEGIGPYRLGERLSDLLHQLPSGPRIIVYEIPGLVHRSVIRAEDSMVLIGGEPGGIATTVSVVGPEVARTESGIHVGSTRDEVLRALGPQVREPERAVDPRVLITEAIPSARFVLAGDRVVAIVATAESGAMAARAAVREPVADPRCVRPAATDRAFGTCLTNSGELVEIAGNELTIRTSDGQRVITPLRPPGDVVFAAPLRGPDGRDELAIVTHSDDTEKRRWSLVVYRFEGGKFVRSIDQAPLYQLSSSNARWIGAELGAVDLYLELASRPDAIEVGGLLTTRQGEAVGDVAVILPVSIARRAGKSPSPEATDAGVSDTAPDEIDDAGANPNKP